MLKYLVLRSFRKRKLTSFLCIFSIALSITLLLGVGKIKTGVRDSFTNSISNADLIVGARSGPLQLLLYTIFHIGSPTNNISIKSYNTFKNHPALAWTIPISLGDSYKGYRVVATDENFFKHYQFNGDQKVVINQGSQLATKFDVILGATVAKKLKHKLGDKVILSHGIEKVSMMNHDDSPFKVVGILKNTVTPIDKSLYINLEGMEAIHAGWQGSTAPEQITSFILRTKNRIALLHLQRFIATFEDEPLTAIIPAMTLTQLWRILDKVELAFIVINVLVTVLGFLSILILIYLSLNERRKEMAILRSLGVSAKSIFALILSEAAIITILGATLGICIQYLSLSLAGPIIEGEFGIYIKSTLPIKDELLTVLAFISLGTFFGLIPSYKAYKTTLSDGLSAK